MRAKSSEKVQQVLSLMKVLNITVEARERVNDQGFIEKVVFWIDGENYPAAPVGAGVEIPPEALSAIAEALADNKTVTIGPAEEVQTEAPAPEVAPEEAA